ncbi:FeoA family protein [Aquifex sp.]
MELRQGESFELLGFQDGNTPLLSKIKSMGLREGKKFRVVMENGRVYLIKFDNTRIVLDKSLAKYLKVRKI